MSNSSISDSAHFFAACGSGDVAALRRLLAGDGSLSRARRDDGATALHVAVGHPAAVRVLLEHGADPSAREPGDNALPLHYAAGGGLVESARALLDAGSDVQGEGDLHRMDTIGWATVFGPAHREMVDLLVERGARHHVFSAIALGDVNLLRRVVAEDPAALSRRLSQFEQEQSALHYVVAPADALVGGMFRTGEHYRTLEALIELGADLEARDARGRTPLDVAMLRGDLEAMRLLHHAGAVVPGPAEPAGEAPLSTLGATAGPIAPMVAVPDMEATVAWYQGIGFELKESNSGGHGMDWASVGFGGAEIMFVPLGDPWRKPTHGVSLWIRTSRIDDLYSSLKRRQLERARRFLSGEKADEPQIRFTLDLHTAFYGLREFGIRDLNGVELMFTQPVEQPRPA